MKINISLKIIGVVFLLFLLVFIIIAYNNIIIYENDVTGYFIEKAKAIAYSIEAGIKNRETLSKKDEMLSSIHKIMWLNSEIVDITYVTSSESGLVNYISNDPERNGVEPEPENYEAFEKDIVISKIYTRGYSAMLKIVSPLHISGQVVGTVQLDFTMESINGKITAVRNSLIVGYLMLMITSAVLLFFLLRILVIKPIQKINKGVESVSSGKLDYSVDIKSNDEIGNLSKAFNRMVNDLKQSNDQIKRHEHDLEEKVSERTKDLDSKVGELTDTKTAILNMMEDMDDANRNLMTMQDELRNSLKELKESDIKKDEFISIAAHELKTPLTSIHGFSQLMQNKDVIENKERRGKYLGIMEHETTRLAKLVTDILDLSRIDLGTLKMAIEEVDVSSLIDDVSKELNIQMKSHGLESEYIIEKDLKMMTDMERLTQIVINLINNSIKYTPKGKITVKAWKDGGDFHFMVKDTGIGIPKDKQHHIFQRFYQVDSSYTRSAGGVGLGLSLCKEFVNVLGGKIWFVSQEGKGSEFHVTLPMKKTVAPGIFDVKAKAAEILKKSEKITKGK
ncbi:MAG: ATP-binding protein [Candidatus Aenigmarchaeota archaeon]|nr:ATP-binding protein [Candidatus Aenigmarchaeota archaeon]